MLHALSSAEGELSAVGDWCSSDRGSAGRRRARSDCVQADRPGSGAAGFQLPQLRLRLGRESVRRAGVGGDQYGPPQVGWAAASTRVKDWRPTVRYINEFFGDLHLRGATREAL